jgi:DNA-binding response OmpR family regulator
VNAKGAAILVVEDDAALRMVCRVTLELERFRVSEAGALDTARAAIAWERPDLVFLDVHLGVDSTAGLLEELCSAGIPVVIVSGEPDQGEFAGRARQVLAKPFDPADLVAAAHRHALG